MWEYKSIILLIQIISTFGAAALGILGLIRDFRDKATQKLTKSGKLNIAGIVLLSSLSVFTNYLKYEEERDQAEIKKKTEDSLRIIDDSIRTHQTELQNENLKMTTDNLRKSDDILSNSKLNNERLLTLNRSTEVINKNLNQTYTKQNELLSEQNRMHYQLIRPNFRLEPLTIHFVVIYYFEHPAVEKYAERVMADIREYLWMKRNKKYWMRPSEDLKSEGDKEFTLSDSSLWLPNKTSDESFARDVLLNNEVTFYLSQKEGTEIIFAPLMYNTSGIVNLQSKETITLKANFYKRQIIKEVKYENPLRLGNDLAFSSVDLIGRELRWSSMFIASPNSYLDKIGFQFPYDDSEQFNRFIFDIYPNTKSKTITSKDVGLDKVLTSIVSTKSK